MYSVAITNVNIRERLAGETYTAATYIVEMILDVTITEPDPEYNIALNYREQGGTMLGSGPISKISGFNASGWLDPGSNQTVEIHFGDYGDRYDPLNPTVPFEFEFFIDDVPSDGTTNWTSAILTWNWPVPDPVNTGFKAWTTLEEYNVATGAATGNTKPNDSGDPDYVAPVYDPAICPLP